MKTVQQHLNELDKDKLVSVYIHEYGEGYVTFDHSSDRTVREIKAMLQRKISDYVDRLRTIPVSTTEDGKVGVLLAHRYASDGSSDMMFSLVHADEVLEDISTVESYGYELQDQSEIMGYFVSDSPLTMRYIYHLMADVMHEASFFGFEQEDLEEAKKSIQRGLDEVDEKEGIPYEEAIEELIKDYDEYDRIVFLDKLTAEEQELMDKVTEADDEFYEYSFRKELAILREMLQKC